MLTIFVKKFGKYAALTLSGLLLIGGFLAWLAGTEPALRWSAQQAQGLNNGRLVLHDLHGSLYGPLHIGSFSYQNGETRIDGKQAVLDWSPLALLHGHIQITQLTVQQLQINVFRPGTGTARATLPESLSLPLSLSAPSISLGHIALKSAGKEYVLSDVNFGVEKYGGSYKFHLHNIGSEWGKGEAEIALGETRPFILTAHAGMRQEGNFSYRAEADVSGNLEKLQLDAKLDSLGSRAKVSATVTPFDEFPVAAATMTADGINPARLRKDLPKADLGALISVARRGADGVEGSILVTNKLPGTWDRSLLPLREMSARFNGTLRQPGLRSIHLDLGTAGEFNGDGQVTGDQLKLGLDSKNFNPRGVHRKMRRMRLAGTISLQAGSVSQELTANLRYQGFQLHLDAQHKDALVELRKAVLRSAGGSVTLNGTLALRGARPFKLAGALQKFNPADFGNYPAAALNASLSVDGTLAPAPQATLKFSVTDSHFMLQPLTGQGRLSVSAARIRDSEIMLLLADNRLYLKGRLGDPDDRLDFSIKAGNLAMLDPELGGQIRATGTLEGRFSALSGNLHLQASNLAWREHYRVDSLLASARLDKGMDGTLALDASLRGLRMPQTRVDRASLNAQGTRTRHTLNFDAKSPDFELQSRFAGGWNGQPGWSGQVTELSNRGRHAVTLKFPAKLEIAPHHFVLNDATVDLAGANLVLHEFHYDAGQLVSSGELRGLQLAYLQDFAGHAAVLKNDLAFSGDWQFSLHDKINGHIALWRERGDIALPAEANTTLGLNRITLNVDALNNNLQGRLEASGSKLGNLSAEAQVMLSQRNGVRGIAGDAPLRANASLAVESLAWLGPLFDSSGAVTLDGAIQAELGAAGTVAQPQLDGSISGNRFAVSLPNLGPRFTEGRFHAKLQDQKLILENLEMRGGGGSVKGNGTLSLEGKLPVMQLSLQADKLEVLSRPDRHLILSGTGAVSSSAKKLLVTAKLKADRGAIELPKGDAPKSSEDVIVLEQSKPAEKKNLPYVLSFNLDFDLGQKFFVTGKGLDAQLGGALNLSSENGAFPSSNGTIRVVQGAYSAYGQHLEIARGILSFQGPVDNPGLDIVALRKNLPVEAGVAITGTALSPRVRLVSTPNVPDSEKLSWLVLGHGLENSSDQDFSALQAAAGMLLATGESVTLQQRIAYATGFEDVSLKGSGGMENTMLALGKRLSSRAYLSYEHGLTGADTLVKISYTLSKRLSVQAQTGTTAAVDLFYTFSFN